MIAHPEQLRLVNEQKRFKVCPAGRRSGKTERAKRKILKEAIRDPGLYFCSAPTRDQTKQIFWRDIKALTPTWFVLKPASETELTVFLKNGSEICLIGLDKPERLEGRPWKGGIIDEIANVKPEAWEENISPALDTPGLDAWCWLIGVPEGLNHYFELAEYAKSNVDAEWGFYTWFSADILSPKAILSAKRRMSPRNYRQEYEASFETATGRVYDDYCNENHTDRVFRPGPIFWTHDFNYLPLSSAILQREGDKVYAVDEIILDHAIAKQSAQEFVDRYQKYREQCPVVVYGDASGHIGEKHGHVSDYVTIDTILKKAGFNVKLKVPAANPAIRDGQNSLRGKILNALGERTFFVNPQKCPYIERGLKTVQTKKGSTFLEEDSEYQHVTTALRYFTAVEFPVYGGKPIIRVS